MCRAQAGAQLPLKGALAFSSAARVFLVFLIIIFHSAIVTLLALSFPILHSTSSCSRGIAARMLVMCVLARDVAAYNGASSFRPLLNIILLPRPQLPADDLEFSRFLCCPAF